MPTASALSVLKRTLAFTHECGQFYDQCIANQKRHFFCVDTSGKNWVFILQGNHYVTYPKTIQFDGTEWTYLSNGSFNLIYLNQAKTEVCRIFIDGAGDVNSEKIDAVERLIRLASQINPGFPSPRLSDDGKSLIVPYFEGTQPTLQEVHVKIIDDYKNIGRVFVDAFASNAQGELLANFKKVRKPGGRDDEFVIVGVDYGFWLLLGTDASGRESPVSVGAWDSFKGSYDIIFTRYANKQDEEKQKPGADVDKIREKYLVFNTIQALLYIQKYHPDFDADNLKNNIDLIECFAKRYRLIEFFNYFKQAGFSDDTIDKLLARLSFDSLNFVQKRHALFLYPETGQFYIQSIINYQGKSISLMKFSVDAQKAFNSHETLMSILEKYPVDKDVACKAVHAISDVIKNITEPELKCGLIGPLLRELAKKTRHFTSRAIAASAFSDGSPDFFQLPSGHNKTGDSVVDATVEKFFNVVDDEITFFLLKNMSFPENPSDSNPDSVEKVYNQLLSAATVDYSFVMDDETFLSMSARTLEKNYRKFYAQFPLTSFPNAQAIIDALYNKRKAELNSEQLVASRAATRLSGQFGLPA